MPVLSEEQRLLSRSEAKALLESHNRTVKRVVRVCDDDAILFIGGLGKPWTAWFSRTQEGISVQYERGWPATFASYSQVSAPTVLPDPLDRQESSQ